MREKKIRTLVIEDSGFMRIFISDILRSDTQIEVVATAPNGHEGVVKAIAFRPDIVITDMLMPEYDGLYVVRSLMRQMPVPIILLSSLGRTDPQIFDALNEGAIEFLDKPKERTMESTLALTTLVREIARTVVEMPDAPFKRRNTSTHTVDHLLYDLLVIGASTGGPSALEFIINNLPSNLPIPVVIAQHMPDRFIDSFAKRLDTISDLKVKVADVGEVLEPGIVYLAPAKNNTIIYRDPISEKPTIGCSNKKYKEYNHPSVDCLFESVAEVFGNKCIAVLLTGMGKDGANGLLSLKNRGSLTIAQDEESSVVFGMPRAAADLGAALKVLPLKHMPGFVTSCF